MVGLVGTLLDRHPLSQTWRCAQLLVSSGGLEHALGHRREAVRRLTEARGILAGLRARPLLERCTREVAAELFLTTRTLEYHLRNVTPRRLRTRAPRGRRAGGRMGGSAP